MRFGERMRARREELGISRAELAAMMGISGSAVGNYEGGVSFPKEEVLLRLFDCLETDPNTLFQDSFRGGAQVLNRDERQLLEQYRGLSARGRESVRSVVGTLCAYRDEVESNPAEQEPRVIPLYRSPAAAGYAAPVFGEDFTLYLRVEDVVRVFDNLFSNLRKYADRSAPVDLWIEEGGGTVRLHVENRVSPAPDRRDSHGVGLPAMAALMERGGGALETEERDGVYRCVLTFVET